MRRGEHRYECQQCGAWGFAYYLLAEDEQGWFNVRVCTGCAEEAR